MDTNDILGFDLDRAVECLNGMEVKRGSIDEDLFVNVFAPYILFDKSVRDNSAVIGKYVEHVGGISIWVDIIKDGEIVGSIPPLLNNGLWDNAPENVDAVVNKSEILNARIPQSGDKIITDSFTGTKLPYDEDVWNELRVKYRNMNKEEVEKITDKQVEDDDDDFDSFLD